MIDLNNPDPKIARRIDYAKGKIKLNLGCGINRMKEYINIDVSPVCEPDVVYDITDGIPFPDRSVNNIFSRDFLEHIPKDKLAFVMNECHRVLKIGGVCAHEVPEAPNPIAFQDPTHVNFFTRGSAYYWMKEHSTNRWFKYGKTYGYKDFRLVKVDILKDAKTKRPNGWIRMIFFK